jgi:DNA-binding MarR family transcriptional regulator
VSTQNPQPQVGPDPDDDFGLVLGRAYQGFVVELNAHLAVAGFPAIKASFGYVFRSLLAEELTPTKLGARLGMTTQGAAKLVDEMERSGYVEKRADPSDARVKLLRLTERARAAVEEARRFHQLYEDRLAAGFGADATASLRRMLVAMGEPRAIGVGAPFRQL